MRKEGTNMADATAVPVVDAVKSDIRTRLEEIEPLIAEADQLRAMLAAAEGKESSSVSPSPQPRRRRRRSNGGNRREQFVKLVKDNPGISVSEAAQRMGIEPNYLYRVAADAAKSGEVEKKDREYHPAS
jgi:hypothetical protein